MNRPGIPSLLCLAAAALPLAASAQSGTPNLFASCFAARADGKFSMLLRQFQAEEPTLPEHHEAGERPAAATYQGARDVPSGHWVWQRPYWFVFRDGPGTAPHQRQWGPEAACGPPDTPEPGDRGTAFAMKETDTAGEWLLLEYAAPIRVTSVEVHETYNPGALLAIAILTPQGDEVELWRARENKTLEEKGRILQVDLPVGFEVERVKLYFASEAVAGWNEIDAVGMRDDKGKLHWASKAAASSTFADVAQQAANVQVLGFQQPALQNVQLLQLRVQLPQPVVLPRMILQAPRVERVALAPVLRANLQVDAKTRQLLQRIAELEAQVKRLEDELAKAKAGKSP